MATPFSTSAPPALPRRRILSIQSHVVSGYVGNKSAVFPLQLLGFDVDVINSVHFSNHTGYLGGVEGDVLKGEQLRAILNGLQRNDLLADVGHVLTGYIGSESFLEAVLDVIKTLRKKDQQHQQGPQPNSRTKVRYVCDPVLGDHGKFYVPESLVQVYKERVIPLADVLTPNQFEVEQLAGVQVQSIEDAKQACRILHRMGPSLIFITSMILDQDTNEGHDINDKVDSMTIMASHQPRTTTASPNIDHRTGLDVVNSNEINATQTLWRVDCPMLPGQYTGTGDLCAALLLAHTALQEETDDWLPTAMEKVVNTMYAVIELTQASASDSIQSRELKLIQSKAIIENPPNRFKAYRL